MQYFINMYLLCIIIIKMFSKRQKPTWMKTIKVLFNGNNFSPFIEVNCYLKKKKNLKRNIIPSLLFEDNENVEKNRVRQYFFSLLDF